MSPRSPRLIAVALVIAVAGILLYRLWPGLGSTGADAGAKAPVPVTVAIATVRDVPVRLVTVGRVQPAETVTLRARVDGMVAQVLFPEGRAVRAGDVLLRLDDADFRTRLAQAQAVLARDEAQLENARAELARDEQLKEKNYVSDDVLKTARTNVAALTATIGGDKAAVDSAKLQLDYTTIRAPFDGRMGARLVFPGTAVKTNDTALAVINRVHPVQVAFAVPEKYLGQLQPLRQGGKLKVGVTADNDAALHAIGEATFVDNAVDATSGTIQVKATFDNRDGRLVPGAFLKVGLDLAMLRNVVTVPQEAVQQNGDASTVFVVANDKAELRPVQVRELREGLAVIDAGIRAGETVVTDGQLRLVPGAGVKVATGAGK